MPIIQLETFINAYPEICFDLSRSIDLHIISTASTNEKAIDGITSGLIGMGQTVTWQARHLGFVQQLTTRITAFDRPHHFRDEQSKGIFKILQHDHFFEPKEEGTLMKDVFLYESPGWILGALFNKLYLDRYLSKFLAIRNNTIKHYAETNDWKELLRVNTEE